MTSSALQNLKDLNPDLKDPDERKHGLSTEQFPVSAYVGSSKNLKDLKLAAILCTGGPDVIRKEAWPFYRTISGVRLRWELAEPKGH